MAIKFISVKCPECGAALNIEEGRRTFFCSYCGTQILLDNENEHIYRHIDEAGIKQAETDRIIKMKQMELAEKKRASMEKTKKFKVRISIILGIIMLASFAIGYGGGASLSGIMVGMVCAIILLYMWINKEDEDDDLGDKLKVPSEILVNSDKSYAMVEAMFRGAGFTNIQSVPLNDLTIGFIKKPGMVESITINGEKITSQKKKYPPDARVVISYHSLR